MVTDAIEKSLPSTAKSLLRLFDGKLSATPFGARIESGEFAYEIVERRTQAVHGIAEEHSKPT